MVLKWSMNIRVVPSTPSCDALVRHRVLLGAWIVHAYLNLFALLSLAHVL